MPDPTTPARRLEPPPGPDVWELDVTSLDRPVRVSVDAPEGGDPAPVLVVLDPDATFPVVSSFARTLATLAFGRFPPLVVVGVEAVTDGLPERMARRFLDLTPTADGGTRLAAVGDPIPPAGGGDAFLAAVTDEVLPFVHERYPADPADTAILGWSLGGLLAAHALAHHRHRFRRYVLISPSLWWGDDLVLHQLEDRPPHGAGPVDVFACVGAREEVDDLSLTWPPLPPERAPVGRMVTNLHRLAELVAADPSIRSEVVVFDDEQHVTIMPAAISRALTFLYGRDRPV